MDMDTQMAETLTPTVIEEGKIVSQEAIKPKIVRPRSYSFKHKIAKAMANADYAKMDHVVIGEVKYLIPATIGSTYWAALKVGFLHPNEKIYFDDFVQWGSDLMKDRDEDKWNKYCSKDQTTVYHKTDGSKVKQKANTWQERFIGNAKTLTRVGGNSPYGQRLNELGHVWEYACDEELKPYFILKLNAIEVK